jgi:hypothetical protein
MRDALCLRTAFPAGDAGCFFGRPKPGLKGKVLSWQRGFNLGKYAHASQGVVH